MTNPLQTKAVLANLSIRQWTGRKLDRKITDEVNESHHAEADAGRYNKLLISKDAFARIYAATRTARVLFHTKTQPWFDEGARILPTALFDDLTTRLHELKDEFNDAADEFNRQYPRYVKAQNKRLNGMFNPEDYPEPSRVRSMFAFHLAVLPFPDVSDFRVSLNKEQLEDTERLLREALDNAMQEPIRRIIEVVGHMHERLARYKPATETERAEYTFRDSLVGNVRELVELLPAFNLTDDPKLAKLTQLLEARLCQNDAEVLREDEQTRKAVAKAAEDILKQANALMA